MCGENFVEADCIAVVGGSPPRVRGKLPQVCFSNTNKRITPACAGKTQTLRSQILSARDHPRVCGENVLKCHGLFMWSGSPPRVRGKLLLYVTFALHLRITPACAGKTAYRALL